MLLLETEIPSASPRLALEGVFVSEKEIFCSVFDWEIMIFEVDVDNDI